MREAVMSGMVLADDSLINLFPDPAWDVAGFRDLAGGVIAVCLYAAVAMVIVGVLTLLPGLITNNMMERAFSWKRLLCALMIPLTIGAATGGFAGRGRVRRGRAGGERLVPVRERSSRLEGREERRGEEVG